MITRKKLYEILAEQDESKREEMLAALPEKELEAMTDEAYKVHMEALTLRDEGKRLLASYQKK